MGKGLLMRLLKIVGVVVVLWLVGGTLLAKYGFWADSKSYDSRGHNVAVDEQRPSR